MDESLVTVARFDWMMPAHLARCRLASAGIPVYLPEECTASIYWHYAKALGGIRLQVSSADAEDARAVLEEMPEDIDEPILTAGERKAERALRAAVLGFLLEPLELYALWLLVGIFGASEGLSPKARRDVRAATVLSLLLSAWLVLAGVILYLGRRF